MARAVSRTSLAAVAVLVLLLAVLATLQFRWIGEVRDAERERLRASAKNAASGVAEEFEREVGRAMRTFGEALHRSAGGLGPAVEAAQQRWSSEARFPALVARVDAARRQGDGRWTYERREASELQAAEWPAGLAAVERALASGPERPGPPPGEAAAHDAPSIHGGPPPGGAPPAMPFVHRIDDPPVLILGLRDFGGGEAASALLIQFDAAAISGEVLPELVRRHFGTSGAYDVAVLGAGDPRPVLYRSRADFVPTAGRAPDAEVAFFGPRAPFEPDRGRPRGDGFHRPWPRGGGPPDWLLVASHRAGSLDAAVDATRARNLAVSAAILLLLGAAVAFLAASAHRASRLARQQVEFVANLTHELRTPLAAILSAGQNLSDGVVADAPRVQKYGDLIVREGRRLSELIETALAQAGIEARGGEVRGGTASVPEAIAQAIEACRPLADERGATVEASVPADLPAVRGDGPALRTLMENLLSNAIKYGGAAGRVTVTASAGADTRSVKIAVRDRGPGIPDAELPRIFEPFYRGREAGGRADGSGIGLSLVQRIVDALGGRIAVESGPRDGTTFTVALPRAEALRGAEAT